MGKKLMQTTNNGAWDVPFNQPRVVGDEISYIQDSIKRGHLSGDGYYSARCKSLLREMTCSQDVLLTHSCTAALEMAAILCKLQPRDEVIMPSFTFTSTANAVVLRGAIPVFVDIDPVTLNIDPASVEAAITPRTKAIFVVHYAGVPADMTPLRAISSANNLVLVEDAAQALGSRYKGQPCGSLADIGTISFHATKNIISGEGGAITLNRSDLLERAEIIREKGTNRSQFSRGEVVKYTWVDLGSSYLPSELVTAFLLAQLETEAIQRKQRLAIANAYDTAFSPLASKGRLSLPHLPDGCEGNGHIFFMILQSPADRTRFIAKMGEAGIQTTIHYIPLHTSPAGLKFGRFDRQLTVTDHIADCLVRLPIYPGLEASLPRVIESALAYFNN